MKLPIVNIDNPPKTFGKLSPKEKKRGAEALSYSIKKTNELWNQKKEKTLSSIKDVRR